MAVKKVRRERRKLRIRQKLSGTSERPRLNVFRSAKHIYVQAVDDSVGGTIAQASTLSGMLRHKLGGIKKIGAAEEVGTMIAQLLLEKGIQRVVFDRNGYLYHGRIKALADAARKMGLHF